MHERSIKADSVTAVDPGLSVLVMLLRPSKPDHGRVVQSIHRWRFLGQQRNTDHKRALADRHQPGTILGPAPPRLTQKVTSNEC